MSCWDEKSQFYHRTLKKSCWDPFIAPISSFHNKVSKCQKMIMFFLSYRGRVAIKRVSSCFWISQQLPCIRNISCEAPRVIVIQLLHLFSHDIQLCHIVTNDFLSNPNSRSCPNFSLLFTEPHRIQFPTHSKFWKISRIQNMQKVHKSFKGSWYPKITWSRNRIFWSSSFPGCQCPRRCSCPSCNRSFTKFLCNKPLTNN